MTFDTRNPLLCVPLSTSFKTGTGVRFAGFHETTACVVLRSAPHSSSTKAALLLGGLSVQGTGEPGRKRHLQTHCYSYDRPTGEAPGQKTKSHDEQCFTH